MNTKTKTNGIHRGKYLFQPDKYDENDNLHKAKGDTSILPNNK